MPQNFWILSNFPPFSTQKSKIVENTQIKAELFLNLPLVVQNRKKKSQNCLVVGRTQVKKNPAYGKHRISRPMQIVAQIFFVSAGIKKGADSYFFFSALVLSKN